MKDNGGLGTHIDRSVALHIAITWIADPASRQWPPCRIWKLHYQWKGHSCPHHHLLCPLHHHHHGPQSPHLHCLIYILSPQNSLQHFSSIRRKWCERESKECFGHVLLGTCT